METHLIASFHDLDHLEQAVGALRDQGAIDIRVSTAPEESHNNRRIGVGQKKHYCVNVYVERSRYRQAEDTILRCGGCFQQDASY